MNAQLSALWNRVFAVLGRVSMYRLVLLSLAALAVISLALSFAGLVGPTPGELAATAAVLVVVCVATDAAAQRLLRLGGRIESSLITAGILLFVLWPTLDPAGLGGIAIAGAVAAASKYVLVWRGRHVLNPAAAGATVLTLLGIAVPALGASGWWVGAPTLALPVALFGLAVVWRTEKVRVVLLFLVLAVGVSVVRQAVQYAAAGFAFDLGTALQFALLQSPFLFLGAFMLSEPLTLPPRRWQQFAVAAVAGVLAGWPIPLGEITLGQERALVIANLVAFAFALRQAVRLTLVSREQLAPTLAALTFRARRRFRFEAGQYLELDVPHRRPDARGTRREFSIVSAPEDLPEVRIAFRDGRGAQSSYKRALAAVELGDVLAATGVWGDFVLPRTPAPALLVAAGIGVTPFVSQLRHDHLAGIARDTVLVYVAAGADDVVFRDELARTGVPVVVFTREDPGALPAGWRWAGGSRLDAAALRSAVPDLSVRHAYISGPAALIADLAPALASAKSVATDAFSGY
jgi:ferredoxin-NADP reductase